MNNDNDMNQIPRPFAGAPSLFFRVSAADVGVAGEDRLASVLRQFAECYAILDIEPAGRLGCADRWRVQFSSMNAEEPIFAFLCRDDGGVGGVYFETLAGRRFCPQIMLSRLRGRVHHNRKAGQD